MYNEEIVHVLYSVSIIACAAKQKHAVLMLDAKRQILERLEKGAKPSSLMQEFNCGKVTISNIKRNKEQILG